MLTASSPTVIYQVWHSCLSCRLSSMPTLSRATTRRTRARGGPGASCKASATTAMCIRKCRGAERLSRRCERCKKWRIAPGKKSSAVIALRSHKPVLAHLWIKDKLRKKRDRTGRRRKTQARRIAAMHKPLLPNLIQLSKSKKPFKSASLENHLTPLRTLENRVR